MPGGRAGRGGHVAGAPRRRFSAARTRRERPGAKARVCSCARRASPGASRPTRPRGCSRRPTPRTRATGRVAALYEGLLAEAGALRRPRADAAQILEQSSRSQARARGWRWPSGRAGSSRHQNIDVGARFLEEALKLDPRTRARSTSCARRTARRAATGIASSRIAEEAATTRRRGRQRDVPPRPGRDDRLAAARQPDPRPTVVRATERGRAGAPAAARVRGPDRRDRSSQAERPTRRRWTRCRRRLPRRRSAPAPRRDASSPEARTARRPRRCAAEPEPPPPP